LLRDGSVEPNLALEAVFDMDEALGLGLKAAAVVEKQPEDPALAREIEGIIAERAEAKKAKDFARADSLRQSLKERGIALVDGPGGTTWRKI
jgi:cysteinyl-tRNA synthetase